MAKEIKVVNGIKIVKSANFKMGILSGGPNIITGGPYHWREEEIREDKRGEIPRRRVSMTPYCWLEDGGRGL